MPWLSRYDSSACPLQPRAPRIMCVFYIYIPVSVPGLARYPVLLNRNPTKDFYPERPSRVKESLLNPPTQSTRIWRGSDFAQFLCNVSPFRINTSKCASKQATLSTFRINTYEKQAGWGRAALPKPPFLSSASRNELVCFQALAHSFLRRRSANSFHCNNFRTLSIATEGVPSLHSNFAQLLCNLSLFRINTYGPPRKCCKQKTYAMAKPFRCNTYKKPGVGLTNVGLADVGRSPTAACLALPFGSGAKLKLRTRLVPNRDQEGRVIHW